MNMDLLTEQDLEQLRGKFIKHQGGDANLPQKVPMQLGEKKPFDKFF